MSHRVLGIATAHGETILPKGDETSALIMKIFRDEGWTILEVPGALDPAKPGLIDALFMGGPSHRLSREEFVALGQFVHAEGATISADFLFNLPRQSRSEMLDDVARAVDLGLDQKGIRSPAGGIRQTLRLRPIQPDGIAHPHGRGTSIV